MSTRNYGIYHQGAIFYNEDFDPVKVIKTVSQKIDEIILPDHIVNALNNNEFKTEIAAEIGELLDMRIKEVNKIKDYSYISNNLIDGAEYEDWFNREEPLMGTKETSVFIFSYIEGEYVYDNIEKENELIENCYMFSLNFPLVWEIEKYHGIKTKNEILEKIKKVAEPMLKDGIEWESRLGYLIGSS